MKPGSVPKRSRTSASSASRAGTPSAFWSLISLRRWSPRTSTSTGSSSPAITGMALISAPAGTPSIPVTASIVRAPGVSTSRGSSRAGGSPSTSAAVALAISTLAA